MREQLRVSMSGGVGLAGLALAAGAARGEAVVCEMTACGPSASWHCR
jgi:hypothetical protein